MHRSKSTIKQEIPCRVSISLSLPHHIHLPFSNSTTVTAPPGVQISTATYKGPVNVLNDNQMENMF